MVSGTLKVAGSLFQKVFLDQLYLKTISDNSNKLSLNNSLICM